MRQECTALPSNSDSGTLCALLTATIVSSRRSVLDNAIQEKPCYEKLFLNNFCCNDPKKKYQYVQDLKNGLTAPCVLYTASLGSNIGNYHFMWKIPRGVTLEAATIENVPIIDKIKRSLPTYHSRALRKEFVTRFGLIASGVKSHVLRQIYRELTGMCAWGECMPLCI